MARSAEVNTTQQEVRGVTSSGDSSTQAGATGFSGTPSGTGNRPGFTRTHLQQFTHSQSDERTSEVMTKGQNDDDERTKMRTTMRERNDEDEDDNEDDDDERTTTRERNDESGENLENYDRLATENERPSRSLDDGETTGYYRVVQRDGRTEETNDGDDNHTDERVIDHINHGRSTKITEFESDDEDDNENRRYRTRTTRRRLKKRVSDDDGRLDSDSDSINEGERVWTTSPTGEIKPLAPILRNQVKHEE